MKKVLLVLVFAATSASAEYVYNDSFDSLSVHRLHELYQPMDLPVARDVLDKYERVERCIEEYKTKRPRRGAGVVQDTLYDMIHNFDQVASRLKGRREKKDTVTDEEKLAAIAVIQCETFYSMGVLK